MFFVKLILTKYLNINSIYIIQQLQKNPKQIQKLITITTKYSPISKQKKSTITKQKKLIQTIKKLNIKTNKFRNIELPIN